MTETTHFLLKLAGVISLLLGYAAIHKCEKWERIAVFRRGKLLALKGPGNIVAIPLLDRCNKLAVGDAGVVMDNEAVAFNEQRIPVIFSSFTRVGDRVRILRFDKSHYIWSMPVVIKGLG